MHIYILCLVCEAIYIPCKLLPFTEETIPEEDDFILYKYF